MSRQRRSPTCRRGPSRLHQARRAGTERRQAKVVDQARELTIACMEGRSSGAANPRDRIVAVAIAGPAPARGQKRSRGAQAAHARFWAIATASDTSILGETPRALSLESTRPDRWEPKVSACAPADASFPLDASVRRGWRESSKRSSASVGADAPLRGVAIGRSSTGGPLLRRHCDRAVRSVPEGGSDRPRHCVFRVGTTLPVVRSRWRDERSWTRAGAPRLPGVIPLFPRGSTLVSEEVGFCFDWARALAAAAGLTSELAPATACWVRSAGKRLFPRPRESGPIAWATSGLPTAGDALSLETGEEQVASTDGPLALLSQ